MLPLLHCTSLFASFDEICGMTMDFVFLVWVTLYKITNTPIHRSAALVLSI